jgi:hypothetical protein
MAVLVAVGDSTTLRVFDGAGASEWTATHGAAVYGAAIDDAGAVYMTGARSSSLTTRVFTSAGAAIWTADHGVTSRSIALGLSGDVWTVGDRSSSLNIRKYDVDDGTLLDSGTLICPTSVYGCAVGPDGHPYGTGNTYTVGVDKNTSKRHATSAYNIWSRGYPARNATHRSIAVDADSNVYVCGDYVSSESASIWKYNSAGTLQWKKSFGEHCKAIALDGDGGVYVGGVKSFSNVYSVRKYAASDGTLIWSQDHGATCWGLAYAGGVLYIAQTLSSGIGWRALDPDDGSALLSVTMSADCYCIAAREFVPAGINTACPALALPIMLGLPRGSGTVSAPSLALRLQLGLPSAPAALPPDPLLWPAPRTYSLALIVGDGFVSLPIASVQCRRRLGASTWMVVEVADWSESLESVINDQIGGEMLIWSLAVVDGITRAGEFLRAIVTEYQAERMAGSGRIAITGRVQTPSYTAASRLLIGVQSRGVDAAGRRTARADVDPLLRPNDTVDDGAETWAAGAIEYQITPRSAWMSVLERADG